MSTNPNLEVDSSATSSTLNDSLVLRDGVDVNNLRLRENQTNVWNYYTMIEKIGEGSISSISLVKRKDNIKPWEKQKLGQKIISNMSQKLSIGTHSNKSKESEQYYALKTIKLHKVNDALLGILHREIELMKTFDHPHIIKAYETYDYHKKNQLCIIMELCTGKDLWSKVTSPEDATARIMYRLLSAVKYMHDRNVVHRDLKLENIMLESEEPDAFIKVIDFGLSAKFIPEQMQPMTARVGTVYTMSPQVIKQEYGFGADLWACGVITYVLLSDFVPFFSRDRKKLLGLISSGKYEFKPAKKWDNISDGAKDFVASLLKYDPKERLNAEQALNHPWLQSEYLEGSRLRVHTESLEGINEKLLSTTIVDASPIKKLALYTIASRANTEDIKQIRHIFNFYDKSGEGVISFDEFKEVLEKYNLPEEDLYNLFYNISYNEDGKLHYTEFIAALLDTREYCDEAKLIDAFSVLDNDNSGYISEANLRVVLDETHSDEDIRNMMKEVDYNNDGKISFKEFVRLFHDKRTATKNSVMNVIHNH